MDKKLQDLFRDLGKAVFEAISSSPDVGETLNRFRDEGYTLTMQLNCKKDTDGAESGNGGRLTPEVDPVFRIDGQDLSFLQSIGIDPTRRRPRRK